MLPIGDDDPVRKRLFPFVNLILIGTCVLVFVYQLTLSEQQLTLFIRQWGTTPIELTTGRDFAPINLAPAWVTLFTSMFLHGGWLHLIGNMVYLFIFGDNVENALGHLGYLVFYLVAGVLASLAQIAIDPLSLIPGIGASGAIAGVLGAYMVLYPAARVKTLVVVGVFFTITTVPAIIVIGLWGVLQFFSGIASLGVETNNMGGVAYFAHIGGFVVGVIFGFLYRAVAGGADTRMRRLYD